MKPNIDYWTLKGLVDHCVENQTQFNGRWVPARPINYQHRPLFTKILLAWKVYKGKLDVFEWPEGQ